MLDHKKPILAPTILMVRPARFGFNAETAVNNAFQVEGDQTGVAAKALQEFDAMVDLLRQNKVLVMVVQDSPEPHTPDSIFPNNWISFHENGQVFLYPMFAENRRREIKPAVLEAVQHAFRIAHTVDYSGLWQDGLFLEGTGSMVLDRDKKIAYACLSPRTDAGLLQVFCGEAGYRAVVFNATDANGQAIYHTNVLMCVGDRFVVICLDAIADEQEKQMVIENIESSGKTLIPISFAQMNQFAGNMLQVPNAYGEQILVMSDQAFQSLEPEQLQTLVNFNKAILHPNLQTIETNGGGSARCMMAEIWLPARNVVHS